MGTRITELYCKEVICVGSGQRLGFVSDVAIRMPDGCVSALIVPGPCRFWGASSRKEEYVIPWECIRRMGPDIILAECCPEECLVPRRKGIFWK